MLCPKTPRKTRWSTGPMTASNLPTELVSQLRLVRPKAKFEYAKDQFLMIGQVMRGRRRDPTPDFHPEGLPQSGRRGRDQAADRFHRKRVFQARHVQAGERHTARACCMVRELHEGLRQRDQAGGRAQAPMGVGAAPLLDVLVRGLAGADAETSRCVFESGWPPKR